jgi:Photosynthetic reaction centre cytochrome C subunit
VALTSRSALAVTLCAGAAWAGSPVRAAPQDTRPAAAAVRQETPSRQEINDRIVARLSAAIAGREQEPAGRVFKNIRFALFKNIPAADLLDIMNGGYSKALGVTCTHCHVETDFASDEKPPKRVAREMAAMHRRINQELGRMKTLDSLPEDRFINCGTCHRGTLHPQKRTP